MTPCLTIQPNGWRRSTLKSLWDSFIIHEILLQKAARWVSYASWPWFAQTKKFFLKVKALPYSCWTKHIALNREVSRQNIALCFALCYICLLPTLFRVIFSIQHAYLWQCFNYVIHKGCPLRGYSGCVLKVKGECMITVKYKGQTIQLPLVVIAG